MLGSISKLNGIDQVFRRWNLKQFSIIFHQAISRETRFLLGKSVHFDLAIVWLDEMRCPKTSNCFLLMI